MAKDIEAPEAEDTEMPTAPAEELAEPGIIPEDFQKKFLALLDECSGSKECIDFMMDKIQELTGQPDADNFSTEQMPKE